MAAVDEPAYVRCDKLTIHSDGRPRPCPNHALLPGEECQFVHVDSFGFRILKGRRHEPDRPKNG